MTAYVLNGQPTVVDGLISASIAIQNTGAVQLVAQPLGREIAPGATVTIPGWAAVPTTLQTAGQAGAATVTLTAGTPAARPGPGAVTFDPGAAGSMSLSITGGTWYTGEGLTAAATFPRTITGATPLYPAAPASVVITATVGASSKTIGLNVTQGSAERFVWVPESFAEAASTAVAAGSDTYAGKANNLSDLASAANARTNLAVPGVTEVPIYLTPGSLDSGSGSPTETALSTASTFVQVWQLPKAAASSIIGVVRGLPAQCVGVRIDATLAGASDASASTATLRIVGTPLISGATWDTLQWSDNVVLCNSLPSALGMAKPQRLETFLPIDDPSVPLALRVIREVTDGFDTWGGSINVASVRVTPVLAPTTPVTVTAAAGYNSWPFVLVIDGALTVVYSVGTQHGQPDSARKIVSRTQQPNGTWTAEVTILDTAGEDDRAVGKGYDASGNPLIWTCTTGVFHLHRYSGGAWSIISSPTGGWGTTPLQVTDVIVLPTKLLCFWHSGTTDGTCAYGVVTSTDGGVTWTQTVIASGLTVSAAPTEISGAYVGSNKIVALGRCETGDTTSNSGMHQIHSTDGGTGWAKNRSNVFDHYKSTPSLIWDGTTLYAYYYRRLWGDLRRRAVDPSAVISAPRTWADSQVVAVGGSRANQDAGNCNALLVGGTHKIAYYSGNATDAAIILASV